MYSVMWSEHCSYKSSKVHLRQFGDLPHERRAAGRHRRERRRRRRRRRLRGHLQGRVAQPPELRRALPGRGHRGRRHRPRHPDHGRPPDRRHGLAALRPRRRPRHRPRAARRRRRRRRLRQLPGPAQHRRRAALRRLLRRQPAGQRAVRRRHEARGRPAGQGRGPRQQGHPVRRPHRRRRHRRRQRAGQRDLRRATARPSGRACRSATRSPRSCSSRRAWRSSPQDLVTGIQDLGGAGLSCATSELASAGTGGMHVDLDTVPLRDRTLTPAEILMSESQERMCAIVEPAKVEQFLAVCRKWDVLATVIGEVTEGDRLTVDWHGERIVDVPPRTVAHEGPVYERPMARPRRPRRPAGRRRRPAAAADAPPAELQAHWLAVVSSPDGADKTWVTEQYDRYVRGNTVLAQPEDAGVVRIDEEQPPRHRAGPRRQRPLRPARPVRRRAAQPGRGLPQRRGQRREAARRHQLPELRLPGGARGHVAVRRGRPRPGRRLPRARPAGHRRQRQPLQPDRRRRDQPDAGHRRARRARGRPHARIPCGWRARRRDGAAARRDAARVRRLGLGERRARPPRRAAAGGRPRRRAARWASCSRRSAGRAGQLRARPRRRRPRPDPRRVGAALRRRRAACTWTATRSPRCSASPPPAPSSRRPTRTPSGRRPQRAGVAGHRAGDDGRRHPRRRRPARAARSPSCGPPGRPRCRRCSATPEATVGTVPAGTVPTS